MDECDISLVGQDVVAVTDLRKEIIRSLQKDHGGIILTEEEVIPSHDPVGKAQFFVVFK